MILFPSDHDLQTARTLLANLLARGNDPRLLADGLIHAGGPIYPRELAWIKGNRDTFRAVLVGAGRFQAGSLDRIYGIRQETGLTGCSADREGTGRMVNGSD